MPDPKKFEIRNNKKYKVKAIIDNAEYGQQVSNQMLGLYYLILWNNYLETKNLHAFIGSYASLKVDQYLL